MRVDDQDKEIMLKIQQTKIVYNHLKDYTQTYEKKNSKFPKNIIVGLDSKDFPPFNKQRSILNYNNAIRIRSPDKGYHPLRYLKMPSYSTIEICSKRASTMTVNCLFIPLTELLTLDFLWAQKFNLLSRTS